MFSRVGLVGKRALGTQKGALSYATPALTETAIWILESFRENGCIRSLRTCAAAPLLEGPNFFSSYVIHSFVLDEWFPMLLPGGAKQQKAQYVRHIVSLTLVLGIPCMPC